MGNTDPIPIGALLYYVAGPKDNYKRSKAANMPDSTRTAGTAMTDNAEVPRIVYYIPYVTRTSKETALTSKLAQVYDQKYPEELRIEAKLS